MNSVWQDLRYGLRSLRKQPAFALLAVVTLGLGIGAATTIFSVVQNVLLDPFDFPADRIVALQVRDLTQARPGGRGAFQVAEFLDYQEQVQSFEEVIAGAAEDVLYSTPEGAEQFIGGLVSVNNFSFLGVPAAIGRTLQPIDAEPGASPVFLLAHKTWVEHFGKDPNVVGRSFVLNGIPTTLVGVMPPRFTKLAADLYLPVVLDRANPEQSRRFFVLQARLKPGITLEEAEAEVGLVAQRLAKIYPKNYPERFRVAVVNLIDSVVGPFRTTVYTLAAAVALLLLIACANVANMLLARATTREREMAVRASLGASRSRLVRQMLVESFLLALMAAGLGCLLAHFGIQALVAAIPEGLIPRQSVIRLNAPVLLFSLGIAISTSIVCGLAPALRAAGKDLVEPLKDTGKGTGGSYRRRRLGSALVVAEVALSIVLLAGAGLLIRSFVKLQTVELGFDPKGVVNGRLALPPGQYLTAASKGQLFRQVLERVKALPGVAAVTTTSVLPPFGNRIEIATHGRAGVETEYASVELCSEGYFRTMGRRLLRGRELTETEVAGARKVAVVNQALAERHFGPDDPIGRRVELKGLASLRRSPVEDPQFEIVGVVADAKNQGIREPALPEALIPHTVTAAFGRGILVKTAGSPLVVLNSLKREVWAVDRKVAVTRAELLTDFLDQFQYAEPRLSLVVMAAFAGTGLTLVALGVFSVIAYTVSRRTHEIGIRMALGAERAEVLRMVLRMALRVVSLGIALGVAASLGATRVLSTQLFGISPHDPATLLAVAAVVLTVGLVAGYVPARHATRVDPMVALRHE
jgi:putative ABC transport system permease protein